MLGQVITDCEQARRLVWYAQEQRSKVIRLDGSTTCNTGHLAIIINVDYTEVMHIIACSLMMQHGAAG